MLLHFSSNIPPLDWAALNAAFFCFLNEAVSYYNMRGLQMNRFVLKIVGASFLVLWWLISGFFKKILDVIKLTARIKKMFVDRKENSKGRDS